jgi:hypothetical protein
MTKATDQSAAVEMVDLPSLQLPGSFLDTIDFVEEASLSLLVSVGELDATHKKVLVPFVSARILGSKQDTEDTTPLFSAQLTLEDSAYLLSDFGSELALVLKDVAALNRGEVKLERKRLELVKAFVNDATKAIEECKSLLDSLQVD